jgi:predicted ATPase/class 3 adenylate cyclase
MGAQSGAVTFLFTDIQGSTRLWQSDEAAMSVAIARHDELLRAGIAEHGGRVFSTMGDGVAAVFGSARAALEAAAVTQRRLGEQVWPTVEPLWVRMGVHSGEAEERHGDYFGTAVNRAARLMEIGHGGQVLCSAATADLAEGVSGLVDLGEHRLRDLDRPVRVFQVGAGSFPPLRSVDAYPGNLPLQVSSFVGRQHEIERVVKAMEASRVVTLTGVGGVGKTRLAVQVAAEVLPRFREGAWLVELAPVRDPDGVVAAFAAVFGLSTRAGLTLQESLVEFLRAKQLLLVVDNCEHLLEPVAQLVSLLERSCAGLVLVVTSREGLAIDGERVVPVPPLLAPRIDVGVDELARADAVILFVERALGADPDFALTAQNGSSVAQICRRLDGVPLAIELAASQVAAMSPAELARGLERRFETLAGGRRGAVRRHQTLRAAIDWSYELCSAWERTVLAQLSVFAGGCTKEAAEAVCTGDPLETRDVFPTLRSLVAKSLVVADRDHPDTRYRLLETIREYAEERLAEMGETAMLRGRHAEYFLQFTGRIGHEVWTANHIEAMQRLDAEQDNVAAVMGYAVDSDDADFGLRLLGNIAVHPWGRYAQPGLPRIKSVFGLSGAPSHPLYTVALAWFGYNLSATGNLAAAEEYLDRAAAARGPHSEAVESIDWYINSARGVTALVLGVHSDAASYFERAAEISKAAGRLGRAAHDLSAAAFEAVLAGETQTAKHLASEGLELARRLGIPWSITVNLNALAGALIDEDPERAKSLLRESLGLQFRSNYTAAEITQSLLVWAQLGQWPETLELAASAISAIVWATSWFNLVAVCNVVARALVDFDAEAAAVLQGAARHFAIESQNSRESPRVSAEPAPSAQRPAMANTGNAGLVTRLRRQTTTLLRETLGDSRLRQLRTQGESMDNDDAVAYALTAIAKAQATTPT